MRTFPIASIRLRTTAPDPTASQVPDLFQRVSTPPSRGWKHMGAITYLPLAGREFLYVSTVLDCFSRKVVGWSIVDRMLTGPIADALRMDAAARARLDCTVFHADHRAQYGSRTFADRCDQLGVTLSMGAVGTNADNPAGGIFHAFLKRETLQGAHDYGDAGTYRRTAFAWLARYNTRRRHSANEPSQSQGIRTPTPTALSSGSPSDQRTVSTITGERPRLFASGVDLNQRRGVPATFEHLPKWMAGNHPPSSHPRALSIGSIG